MSTNGCCGGQSVPPPPPANSTPVTWCAGNYSLTFQNGRVVKSPRPSPIADGTYPNATITVVDGCITAVQSGTNVVFSACDPCVTPTPPPPVVDLPIDGNGCNLSMLGPDGLLTQLITANSACIQFTGCGVSGLPLTAIPIISTDAGNILECRTSGLFVGAPSATAGVNFVGCGIQIVNGVITILPPSFQPVLGIISSDGSLSITRGVADPCLVDIIFAGAGGGTGGAGTGGAISVSAVGQLPPLPTAINWVALVGAANPRDVYVFVVGTGWRQINGATVNL